MILPSEEVRILEQALSRVKKGWTQLRSSKNARGDIVSPDSTDAVCWCLYGALYDVMDSFSLVTEKLRNRYNIPSLMIWNDHNGRKVEDVIGLLEKAIRV